MEARILVRHAPCLRLFCYNKLQSRLSSNKDSSQQVHPIGDYYASLLNHSSPTPSQPVISKAPTTASTSPIPPIASAPSSSVANVQDEPSILFSSRLSSPLERRSEIRKKSTLIAGVWVPPRPEEPDNCCMSGCVNCVWDRYRDELEEWALAMREVTRASPKERSLEQGKKSRKAPELQVDPRTRSMRAEVGEDAEHTAVSIPEDGGGSEALWGTNPETMSEELFKSVPVGIREFMKQEKRLKEKHLREGTTGG